MAELSPSAFGFNQAADGPQELDPSAFGFGPEKDVAKPSGIARRALGDTGVSLAKGIIGVPEAAVGLANLPTGGLAGKAAQAIGFAPKEWKDALDEYYSPEQKAANAAVQQAQGFGGTLKAAIQNPSVIAGTVAESLPLMIGGGAVARALPAGLSAVARGAIGEGIVGAGSASEQMRQSSEDGLQSPRQAIASLASGAGTAAFGALGGKLSQKMGIADVDTLLAGGSTRVARDAAGNVINKGLPRRVIEGGLAEGALEELPQSMWEQAAQNVGTGQPIAAGVPEAGAMGMLAGTAMGSVAGGIYKPTIDPSAGPMQAAAAVGITSGAVQQAQQEQAAVTLQTQSENKGATNEKTNPSDARTQGASLAQDSGPGEAPIQAASSPLATGLAGHANPTEVTTAPQGPAAASPFEQQQAIAAPESTVTPSAPIVDTTQAVPTGVPQQPTIGGISNGNQTEITQPAAAGRQAQSAPVSGASVAPPLQYPQQPTTNAGPLPQQATAMPVPASAFQVPSKQPASSLQAPSPTDKDSLTVQSPATAPVVANETANDAPQAPLSLPDAPQPVQENKTSQTPATASDAASLSSDADNKRQDERKSLIEERKAELIEKRKRMDEKPDGVSSQNSQTQTKYGGFAVGDLVTDYYLLESGRIISIDNDGLATIANMNGTSAKSDGSNIEKYAPTEVVEIPIEPPKPSKPTLAERKAAALATRQAKDADDARKVADSAPKVASLADRLKAAAANAVGSRKALLEARMAKLEAAKLATTEVKPSAKRQSQASPIMRRDDLVGAIMRVTGGNGIAANMALTIAGDTAPKLTRLRGLFTNRGTSDLGEVAMLLREEEGFDVRDGERLSELIRDASFGNVAVSMERHGRDMDADKERRHRDRIRAQAKKYGVKVVGVKFSVVEGRVLFIEQRRQRKAVELLLDRDKARFDAAVAQSEGLVSDDEIQAILNDVAERGITGRDAWQEALVLQRQLAEEARFKQEQGYIENAEDRATDEEPDWFKDFDDEADSKLGNEGTTAASDDFGLEQQTISDIDRQEADRVAAEKAKQADAAQEAADRAASEKQSLADKIKARAEDPDNFQFGEDSKAAAKPMGGLFDQPAWPTKTEKPAQEYAEGDKVRFTPHDVGELRPVVEGILIQKASTTGGNFRLRIRTETPNEHGGGNVTPQVYSQNGTIEKIGDGLNAPRDRLNMTPDQAAQHRVDMLAADFTSTIYEESKTDDFDPAEVPAGAMGWAKDAGVDERAFLNSVISAVEKETFRRKAGVLAALRAGMQAQSANPEPVADPKMSVSANTIFTESAADAARALLKRKLGQLNSGIDPEIMQAGITLAGYHIEKGARTFAAYAKAMIGDLGDAVLPYLKSWYMGVKFDPRAAGFEGMDSSAAVEAASVEKWQTQEQENVDDERSSPNLERDSQDANDENGVGSTSVRDGSGIDSRDGKPGVRGAETDSGAGSSNGLPGREAAVPGTDSDRTIYTGKPELSPGSAGNSVDERSGTDSLGGPAIEPPATAVIEAAATGRLDLAAKVAAQAAAPTSPQASIKDALPMLQDGQQEDVAKAEKRFSEPDGYGMLFTNGTGTGKTFTGLGVVKRFVNAGKSNILIVAPNDKIIEDWQKSGKLLGLDVGRIADTNDAGRGVVITTYANMGQNNALAGREWDLVVHDEAHYLAHDKDGTNTNSLNALRAITLHPDGANDRTKMLYGDILQAANSAAEDAKSARMSDDARNWPQAEAHEKKAAKLFAEFADRGSEVKEYVESKQGSARPRALFLSFTPFAYEPTIDWANGYLFDYNEGRKSDREEVRGYNEGSNRSQFFMQNFGYRMRYGKLTKPDAKVDSALMQRQFNSYLKKKGSLSGRMLDVAADYDRRFVLVDSAIGSRIDEALQWFEVERKKISNNPSDDPRRSALYDVSEIIAEKFDYLSRRYLLEAIKAREVVPHIREHLAMGRKVVVFHDYKKGGGFNPFDMHERTSGEEWSTSGDTGLINEVIAEFRSTFADLIASPLFKASSPITYFQQQFPDVLLFNGDVPAKKRRENVAKFQDDDSGPQVLLAQSAAAKEGISLHDTTGKHQRVMFNLGQPTQPTTAMQQEGRIYRIGQVTDAIFRYLNTGTNWEKWAFATTIATRASAAENLGSGELARALKSAFISGFEESGDYRAGMEGEGKGGKDRDKASNDAITEYDRARAFYFGTQKKNSRTKAQEGHDYFATPEPVGLKMVEWADIRPGDDVLEPSAGHGAIARWMPDSAKRTAVEPSMSLRPRLAMVFDGDIIGSDFESLNVVNKYDAIVMNPPFGSGGRMAVDHLSKAATHLRDGGRIVALLPRGPAADKNLEKWYEGEGEMRAIKPLVEHPTLGPIYVGDTISTPSDFNAVVERAISDSTIVAKEPSMRSATTHFVNSIVKIDPTGPRTKTINTAKWLYLIADVDLPTVTFERAGTAVRSHIIVLEKQTDKAKLSTVPQQISMDYTDAANIGDLFARMENAFVRPRENARKEDATAKPSAEAKRPAGKAQPAGAEATVEKALPGGKLLTDAPVVTYTTKSGKKLEGVIAKGLSKDDAKAIDPFTWAKDGGFFIRVKHVVRPKDEAAGLDSVRYNLATDTQSTPADRAVYGMVADGKSAAEVLSFISKASRRPFNRVLASHLARIGVAPNITLDSQGGWRFGNTSRAQRYAAAYNPKTDTVALFTPRDAERHALHEMVHAATLKAIASGGTASVQMRGLFLYLKRTKALAGQYGMSSLDEFVAEAFSNPKFQQALKAIPAPAGSGLKSAWQWFVRAVARILGLRTPAMETALDRAMTIGAQLMRENAALLERNGEKLDAIREADEAVRFNAADELPPTITVDGVERPTTNSNGDTGSAKIVSGKGDDLVTLYHGTTPDGIESIRTEGVIRGDSYFGVSGNNNVALTPSKETAKEYSSDGDVVEVRIPKSKLVVDPESNDNDDLDYALRNGLNVYSQGDVYLNDKAASASSGAIRYNIATDWISNPTVSDFVANATRSDKSTSIITPFNTQYHKAHKWAAEGKPWFKRVFDLGQKFLSDTSRFAVMAQDAAPAMFHEVKSLADAKTALRNIRSFGDLSGATHRRDIDAAANPLYEGTLYGGGNPMSGIVFSDSMLRHKYKLTDRQIRLYREALAAVNVSLDEMAKSIIARHAKQNDIDFNPDMDIDDMADAVIEAIEDRKDDLEYSVGAEMEEEAKATAENLRDMDQPEEAKKTLDAFKKRKDAAASTIARLDKTIADINGVVDKNRRLQEHGYFPLMRFGKHTVTAKDAEGNTAYFGMFDGIPLVPQSGQYQANKVAAAIRAEHPEWEVTTGIHNTEKYKLYEGMNLEAVQLFAEHMDKDSLEPFQEFLRLATGDRSVMKRLVHRQGTPGFDRDVRRTLAQFIVSNARHASSSYNLFDMRKAAESANKDGGDIGAEAVKLYKYVAEPAEEAHQLRAFLFFNFLGGSIASAMVNLSQVPMMTFPYLTQYESAGKLANRLRMAARTAVGDPAKIPGTIGAALVRAEQDGVTAPQEIHQLTATAANSIFSGNPAMTGLLRFWGMPFSMAESFNRRTTFIAAYQIAEAMTPAQLAATGTKTAFEFAERAVTDTQGIYNKGNRMNIGRGAVGATLMTFKQFSIMYLELLRRLPRNQQLLMIGMMTLAAGAGGWPFAEDVEDIIDTFGQWLGFGTNSKRWIRNTIAGATSPQIADILLNGAASQMGIDLHSRLGTHNLIPGSGVLKQSSTDKWRDASEFFGPAASVLQNAATALQEMATGHAGRAVKAMAPVAAQNAIKGYDMASTGYAEDSKGRRTIPVNGPESVAKGVGFNPKTVADFGAIKRDIAQDTRMLSVKREEFTSAIADAILSGDRDARKAALAEMAQWNMDNPKMRVVIDPGAVVKRVKEARTEGADRFLKAVPKAIRADSRQEFAQS